MKIEITDEAKALKYLPAMVNLLRSIPRQRFSIKTWAQKAEVTKERPCGATACAIGYSALHPYFRGTRISLQPSRYSFDDGAMSCPLSVKGETTSAWTVSDDLSARLGIGCEAAERFFFPSEYPNRGETTTPKQVAQRIERDLISTVGKAKYTKALRATKHVKYSPPTKAQLKRIGLWQEQEA